MDENTILFTGGTDLDSYTDKTSFFDIESQQWTEGPKMNQRKRQHGCATFELQGRPIVIVAGGYNNHDDNNDYLKSVEFLDSEDRSRWIQGII